MARFVPIEHLPTALGPKEAMEAAYPDELQRVADALARGLPVLVECDKGLVGWFYAALRDRVKPRGMRCRYVDGRVPAEPAVAQTALATMTTQLRDAVRGGLEGAGGERRVVVLPHLDLLTTSGGTLTSDAREVVSLLYENPEVLWLGFRDLSFPIPEVIRRLFPHRITLVGVARDRLAHLVTQREARKLGREGLDVYALYKHVSGTDAVKLRRILGAVDGEDLPADPSHAWAQVRDATIGAELSVPNVDLRADIGGYDELKRRIERDVIDIVSHKESLEDAAEIERVESLIPRGIIFHGPPGTGKTLFAKALASSLGAAVQVVSGPELKSRWVGESEENIRRLFLQARRSAPSLIVFDELDAFAGARGSYGSSGVEHSMVNQLLTEMDGFGDNEMVFVVGTTNFVESLDPALLRPGRFELMLEVGSPDAQDRRTIFGIYDRKLELGMTEEAFDHATHLSELPLADGRRWTGDHIQALCRSAARHRIRKGLAGEPTDVALLDAVLDEDAQRPKLTEVEEHTVATHEAGHAIVALYSDTMPPIRRISIRGDIGGALGFVSHHDPTNQYVVTRGQLLDRLAVLFGGRAAEEVLLDDVSIGAAHDLARATEIARGLVERFGLSELPLRDFGASLDPDSPPLADATRESLDVEVARVLESARTRATEILAQHFAELVALRDLLVERKVVDANALSALAGED